MKTPARSEGSVTFSLGELMKLEDERVAGEARERTAREQAIVDARVEAARRERAEEEARARAEEEASAQRRRTELEEMARREAMQKATVEQARLEVEARTRADERERERRHELDLMTRRTAEPKPTGIGALLGATGLGGGLMLAVTLVIHFGVTQPANERRFTELDLRAGTAEQKVIEADRKIENQQKHVAVLEKNKSALEAKIQELQTTANTAKPPVPGKGGGGHAPAPPPRQPERKTEDCDDKIDPMCFGKTR